MAVADPPPPRRPRGLRHGAAPSALRPRPRAAPRRLPRRGRAPRPRLHAGVLPGRRAGAGDLSAPGRHVDAVERAGFTLVGMRAVADLAAASLADALERARLRADTILRHLPDGEFHAGLRRLEAAVAAEDPAHPAGPVFGQISLVVFAR